MNRIYGLIIAVLFCACISHAESRLWTSTSGTTLEGEYVNFGFDAVNISDANGKIVKIPFDQLSEVDQAYVELMNPPDLSVDYRESSQPKEFTAEAWVSNGGSTTQNHPIYVIDASFGALIKQKSTKEYNHDLVVEMYVFTEQNYDPDKYHLIAHVTSKPFRLNKKNKFRFEYNTPNTYNVIYYNLYSLYPRGEKPSKYLILVRDERGEIIAHKGRSEWLIKNLDKLEKLPVGSWLNDKCKRVHPSQPPRTRRDSFQV
ncbi:MAG: hypothetical protein JXR25_17095 [Pontiellaceae bacterium]|nr:hypothetical protein [Pontiellaceae bacterium]